MIKPRSVVHSALLSATSMRTRNSIWNFGSDARAGGELNGVVLRAGTITSFSPKAMRRFIAMRRTAAGHITHSRLIRKYEDAKVFLASMGVDVFEEEDRKKGVFVGRQFYIRDPDGTVIEFTEWDGTSRLD